MGDRPDQPPADRPGARRTASARPRPATSPRARAATASRASRPTPGGSRPAPRAPQPRKPPSQNTMVVVLSVLSVIVVSLVVYAFVLRPSASVGTGASSGATTTTTLDPTAPGTSLPDSAFAVFTSQKMGFSIKYPTSWPTGETDDGEMVVDAGGGDAISVRLLQRTAVPTTPENLANIKAVTDGVVVTDKSVTILKVQQITVNGMPGYYYLYTFTEPETGTVGAHAHYFLFRGRNMYTMIFQALPQEGFGRLSRVFDQMAASFQTVPDTSADTTPTTAG